jgi:hypothetical protein
MANDDDLVPLDVDAVERRTIEIAQALETGRIATDETTIYALMALAAFIVAERGLEVRRVIPNAIRVLVKMAGGGVHFLDEHAPKH